MALPRPQDKKPAWQERRDFENEWGAYEEQERRKLVACASQQLYALQRLLNELGGSGLPPTFRLFDGRWKLCFQNGEWQVKVNDPQDNWDDDKDARPIADEADGFCKLWFDEDEFGYPRGWSLKAAKKEFEDAKLGTPPEDEYASPNSFLFPRDEDRNTFWHALCAILSSGTEHKAEVVAWIGECISKMTSHEADVFFFCLPLYEKYYFEKVGELTSAVCGLYAYRKVFPDTANWKPLDGESSAPVRKRARKD